MGNLSIWNLFNMKYHTGHQATMLSDGTNRDFVLLDTRYFGGVTDSNYITQSNNGSRSVSLSVGLKF